MKNFKKFDKINLQNKESEMKGKVSMLQLNETLTKEQWFEKYGFSADGVTYLVAGGNTFYVKDVLKSCGCVFNKLLNWHSPKEFELEDELKGFTLIPINFDDVYEWNEDVCCAEEKPDAKETVKRFSGRKEIELASTMENSEWMGEIGDRIRKVPAKIVGKKDITTQNGDFTVFTFESGNSVLCWFTSTRKNEDVGDNILLSGTIKDLREYNSQKQTILTRCLLKPLE